MTAVEWLTEQFFSTNTKLKVEEIIEKAKAMELQQKFDAFNAGYDLAINGETVLKF